MKRLLAVACVLLSSAGVFTAPAWASWTKNAKAPGLAQAASISGLGVSSVTAAANHNVTVKFTEGTVGTTEVSSYAVTRTRVSNGTTATVSCGSSITPNGSTSYQCVDTGSSNNITYTYTVTATKFSWTFAATSKQVTA